jgi:uncharacterized protein YqiB (DUF1249 family)
MQYFSESWISVDDTAISLSSDNSIDWPLTNVDERNEMNAFAHHWLRFELIECISVTNIR